jgi:hypothetical protein
MHKRYIARGMVVIAAMVMSVVLGAGTAMAVNWEPLRASDYRQCAPTISHPNASHIRFQACMRFTGPGSTSAHPELIVSNTTSTQVRIAGTIDANWPAPSGVIISCAPSPLGGPVQVLCKGPAQPIIRCGRSTVFADLTVNGVSASSPSKHHDWHPPSC